MVSAKSVARDFARARKRPLKGPQHTIGVSAAAYIMLKKRAMKEGVPITTLASGALFAGVDEAARAINEEIEATS